MKKRANGKTEYEWYRYFAHLSPDEQAALIAKMSDEEAAVLRFTWEAWARDKQLPPPGNWKQWLILAGRGFGKTRSGSEWMRTKARTCSRLGLIGRTAADVRDVMVEGESGILACSPPWERPIYQPSRRRLLWPNGAQATTYTADEPDMLRGPQHEALWMDEPGAWQYVDAYDQAMFGLRLGAQPQAVLTTTPRVTLLIKKIIRDPATIITKGTTYENKQNLAPAFFAQILRTYEGTRLGRQEIEAELLEDAEGALWKRESMIEAYRVRTHPDLVRIVVAIDPAVTAEEGSDETGMIVAGLGSDGHGYVLDDRSLRVSPMQWAEMALTAYAFYHADRIVAEVNNGGELVETTIRLVAKDQGMRNIPYAAVHASRGKQVRAEPVSALYERGLVHHVGCFPELEDQMCSWEPGLGKSPDRLDALVWAFTELMVGDGNLTPSEHVAAVTERLERQQQREQEQRTPRMVAPPERKGYWQ